ncbi:acyl-CoA dehydratase activase [Desulfoscipio sp. XC116]|uniref:acyl-CoA dehydratase activase n=1 Tax=Desulfoscipio sp. XC116 TaxID=3144975 RepID=UPI00325BCA7D
MYSVGLDLGCSTMKYVILNKEGGVLKSRCTFHKGNIEKAVMSSFTEIEKMLGNSRVFIGITGDLAAGYKALSAFYINETTSIIEAVENEGSAARSIMEIGAQKAKYITGFSREERANLVFAMNGSCAAGTGAFIEEQIQRLGIDFERFDKMAKKAKAIPGIAGRCSVFSKTDMIHHQQLGVAIEDILQGLVYALIRNYKANVVQKHPLHKPVLLIGGVMCSENVVGAIKDIFGLLDEDVIRPERFQYFAATGAALCAKKEKDAVELGYVREGFKNVDEEESTAMGTTLDGFGSGDSLNKHICNSIGVGEGYLGIDIGSTSTNFVVIDAQNNVLFNSYLRTAGKPLEAVEKGMAELKKSLGEGFLIKSTGVTGSGRVLIGQKLDASLVVDEITAQARGAVQADSTVDTVFEIGGQDSKYISIKDGMVTDFEMNKICAAGTGAFIEEQIKKLGITLQDFEGIALKSRNPLDLGDRCTVFIEGNIAKALAKGEKIKDIAAGLAFSIVGNYLNRVVGNRKIGDKILLQGGIAYNQAIVNAFRAMLKKEVRVPMFFSVTGALGSALLAKEKSRQSQEKKAVSEDYDIEELSQKAFLKGYTEERDPNKKTVGIPRVLFINKLFPMFNEIFKNLGLNVLLSRSTDDEIVALSRKYSLDETCFPIKLINGHVAQLLNQGVDYIFLPSLHTMKHSCSKARKDYACVYMQTAAKLVNRVMGLEDRGIVLISPGLSFRFGKDYLVEELVSMGKILKKSRSQMMLAVMSGMKRFLEFEKELENLGSELIAKLTSEEKVFIIISRAYNIADPRLNMQIPEKLKKMGYKVISLSHIPAHNLDIAEDYPNMYWPFGQHILSGIKIAAKNPQLFPIYITNHGCGPDTVISRYFKEEAINKPYLHIETDEHYSSIGVMTRVEAFVNSVENYCKSKKDTGKNVKGKPCGKQEGENLPPKLLLPCLYPYSTVFSAFLSKKGIAAKGMEPTGKESMDLGKKLSVAKEYLSMIALAGDVLFNVKKRDEENYSIFIPTCEGSEVPGQYFKVIENELKKQGYNMGILAPFIEDMPDDKAYGYEAALLLAAGDLIMAADKEDRDHYLEAILKMIRENSVSESALISVAREISERTGGKSNKKRICVLGEFSVLFNDFLNGFQLEALEKNHKIIYQPLFENLLFLWFDKLRENKKGKDSPDILERLEKFLFELSSVLGKHSPFEESIKRLLEKADNKLGLYAGGTGRYRMSKLFFAKDKADGTIIISSMYENTATALRILNRGNEDEIEKPVLELQFDHNDHSRNGELLDTFIKYLP